MLRERKLTYELSWEQVQAIEKQMGITLEPIDPLKGVLENFVDLELDNLKTSEQITEAQFDEAKEKSAEYAGILHEQVLAYEGPLTEPLESVYDAIAKYLHQDMNKKK